MEARYVSPTTYSNWDCQQLWDEKGRITTEVSRVSDLQRENANTDAAMVAVGMILFWPALFALAATKDRKDELGSLKGQYTAVDQSMAAKQCAAPPEVMEAGAPAADGAAATSAVATLPAETDASDTAPAPAVPAVEPADPDEVIVCQTGNLALSRPRGECLAGGGHII
ncbi:MAG: hypothetical protein ACK4QW_04130 [Alphaproteobacteria bacterium]